MKELLKGIVLMILELLAGAASGIVIICTIGIVVFGLWMLKLLIVFILDYAENIIAAIVIISLLYLLYEKWKTK